MAFRLEIADFGVFYEETYDRAYRTALGIVRDPALAADVTQEAYVSAYRQRDRFRGGRPLTGLAAPDSRQRGAVGRAPPAAAEAGRRPDAVHRTRRRGRNHEPARPPRCARRPVAAPPGGGVLRYYHDYDYVTIAQILGTTSTNVGAMLSRALDQLKVALDPIPGVNHGTGR